MLWHAFPTVPSKGSQNKTIGKDLFYLFMRSCQNVWCRMTRRIDRYCTDIDVGIQNPYDITTLQELRMKPISHQLQLARRTSFPRCVPLVHAVMWIHLEVKTLTCTVFFARRWTFTHFSRTSSYATRNGAVSSHIFWNSSLTRRR